MIISASRRTDIPAFYSEWFLNRIKEGFVDVLNPFNPKQANRISLKKDDVTCIVFWTKDVSPILEKIDQLEGYNYYFQYTLNGYGKDVEANVPQNYKKRIDTFIALSNKIGKNKVVWRYDPILINEKYTIDGHIRCFEILAKELSNYTNKCVFSFLDMYNKTIKNTKGLGIIDITEKDMDYIASELSKIAKKYNIELATCCEKIDLEKYGIKHNSCIDGKLIKELFDLDVDDKLDKQREYCGCLKCHDIGAYNTCLHQCKYCYASYNYGFIKKNVKMHNPNSSVLVGEIHDDVKIY